MRWLGMVALLTTFSASAGWASTPNDDLLEASSQCDLPAVKVALSAKANVNARSDYDETPLMEASWNGCVEVVRTLIAAGADVNAGRADDTNPEMSGDTALTMASSSSGRPEIVRALITAGANVNAKDADGYTPLAAAARYGQLEAAQALVAAGADVNAREKTTGETPLAEATFGGNSTTSGNFGALKGHLDVADFLRQHGGHVDSPRDNSRAAN